MIEALGIFAATFVAVFTLGFQSLNVNNGHYMAAAITSGAIGGSHLVLYKVLPDGNAMACAAYLVAGPLAITSSMWDVIRSTGFVWMMVALALLGFWIAMGAVIFN